MRQKYQGCTKVKRAQLQALGKYFEVLNMKIGESIEDYFSRALVISNKMNAHGEKLTQDSNDMTAMTADELQSSLLVHEQRMKGQKEDEQVLNVSNGGRCGRERSGRGRGHGGRGLKFNKETFECYKYHKL
ncbi:retrovirus-related Pol polyprotein from transposon TNT 1-94, partial [Trifolium pratense]